VHEVGERGDIRDVGGHIRDAYGLSDSDIVVVRPDGYIGVSLAERQTLTPYMARVGLMSS
jgi:hypothetical protein